MKILVFGISGLVGTEFQQACKGYSINIIGPSHTDIDITEHKAVREYINIEKPDVILNLVAIPSINPCEEDPDEALSIHVTAPVNLIKLCRSLDLIYIQASSHAVFDGFKKEPYSEGDQPNPGNIYGVSKYASELLTANICKKHYIIRFPTMYGARRNNSKGFVDKMIELIEDKQDIRVADDKMDSVSYAKDLTECLRQIILENFPYGIYHIANAGSISYYDFVVRLRDLVGGGGRIIRAKDKDFPSLGVKPLRTSLLSTKLKPLRRWDEALEDYISNGKFSSFV